MDLEQEKFDFLEKSIPSHINKVNTGELDTIKATRYFSNQLKVLKDRQRSQFLLNKFNQQLKEDRERKNSPSPTKQIASVIKPVVIIDGPYSIHPGETISLSAHIQGFNEEENYYWQTEGTVPGVRNSAKGNSASKEYAVQADKECESGTLYITANGIKSGASGSFIVQVLGVTGEDAEQTDKDDDDDRSPDNDRMKEPSKDKAKPGQPIANEREAEPNQEEREDAQKSALQNWLSKEGQKKVGDWLKKKLSKAALKELWILLAPYWGYVVAIILFGVLGFALYGAFAKKAASGEVGSTIHQELDLANDTELLEQTLLSAGDKDVKAAVINKTMPDIQKELLALKEDADSATKDKIDQVSAKIDQFISNNDSELGNEIVAEIKQILADLELQAPVVKLPTRSPLDKITDYNSNLHNGTPLNKEVPKNEGHTTYMYPGEGKADAVDLYAATGSAIYPIFSGKVIDLSDDGTGHKKIIIENGDYQILYANFDPEKGITVGQTVNISSPLGKIIDIEGQTQVHIELAYQGKPITTTELDKISHLDNTEPWGKSLWNQMKKVLNLK